MQVIRPASFVFYFSVKDGIRTAKVLLSPNISLQTIFYGKVLELHIDHESCRSVTRTHDPHTHKQNKVLQHMFKTERS
jgi:hypothetical protein